MDETQMGSSTPYAGRTGPQNGGDDDESGVGPNEHRERIRLSQPQGSLGKRPRLTSPSVSEPRKRPRLAPSDQLQKYIKLNRVTFTEEHDAIFRAAKTHDIILAAPFGVGKTTILEAIVAGTPDERTLILTRGRLQCQAIGSRLLGSGCKLAFVETLSTFAAQLFPGERAWHSDGMARVMRRGLGSKWCGDEYRRVVVDEFQDCTREEYYMIYTALKSLPHDVRLIFVGNECQSLFASLGGDSRFLGLADMGLFGPTRQWKSFTLGHAFRTTCRDAAFINNVFLFGQEGRFIAAHEPGRLPIYIYGSSFNDTTMLNNIIYALVPLIEAFGREGIAILMPSTRNIKNRLPGQLLNTLREFGYDVVQPPSDDTPLDPAVFAGKIAVANYHQFQGLERPVVVVLGLDESYFKYYGRNLPTDRCPDAVLLALTRAKVQLILVHCASHATMPFVRADLIRKYADFRPVDETDVPRRGVTPPPSILPREVCVSDLARNISSNTLQVLIEEHLTIIVDPPTLRPPEHIIPRGVVTTDWEAGLCEDVGNVTSLIFTAAVEQSLNGTILQTLNADINDLGTKSVPEQVSCLARAAIARDTERSGCVQRKVALKNHRHDWITERDFLRGCDLLRGELAPTGTERVSFEVEFSHHNMYIKTHGGDAVVALVGRVDAIVESSTGHRVVEIKCVNLVTMADKIQAAEYGYLYAYERGLTELPSTTLFNLLDGGKIQITATVKSVEAMNRKLLQAKYERPVLVGNDDDFLEDCSKIREIVDNNFR
ncbi:P-loop containing nucleoside triphosphate hydrolase protein [Mycena venus]|uniref:P-loop containing nucleoside triphosphate hydrolase protein n=1 Tax=Mycena venus TaxID=2733690 RepID=A0A8H6Y0Y8_9AGAR|nr:P-loop containing nucleoside triphosphate hydrolase protein [Mycena venus]